MKILEQLHAKGKNKRIIISLFEDDRGEKIIRVNTKTLIDFKSRHIVSLDNAFSIETFAVLTELSKWFIDHPKMKNNLILKELSKIKKFEASSTLP